MSMKPHRLAAEAAKHGLDPSLPTHGKRLSQRLAQQDDAQRQHLFTQLYRGLLRLDGTSPAVDRSQQLVCLEPADFSCLSVVLRGESLPPESASVVIGLDKHDAHSIVVRCLSQEQKVLRYFRRRL